MNCAVRGVVRNAAANAARQRDAVAAWHPSQAVTIAVAPVQGTVQCAGSQAVARHRRQLLACSAVRQVVFGAAADDFVTVELKVEGMMCGGCSSRIEDVIKKMDGVKTVTVSLEKKLAQIEVKAKSQVDAAQALPKLVEAIKDLGFEAEPHCA